MKKFFILLAGLAALQLPLSAPVYSGQTAPEPTEEPVPLEGRVMLCHVPKGNPAKAKTLTVDASSVEDHLGHGDSLGECG